jgi:phosphoglucomutase
MDYIQNYKYWCQNASGDILKELSLMKGDDNLLRERFSKNLSFGTAGMRGIMGAGSDNINVYTVAQAAEGLCGCILKNGLQDSGVAISYDTRNNSRLFAETCYRVLRHFDIKTYIFKDAHPVPMLSYAVRRYKAAFGIMITASHNPKQYNGFKLYNRYGGQLTDGDSDEILGYIDKTKLFGKYKECKISDADFVDKTIDEDYFKDILNALGCVGSGHAANGGAANALAAGRAADEIAASDCANALAASGGADGNTASNPVADALIVYTSLHGTGYPYVAELFKKSGIRFKTVDKQAAFDGNFPTVISPNPENEEGLCMAVEFAKNCGGHVVVATDPDADRMAAAVKDDGGEFYILNGNQTGVLLFDFIIRLYEDRGALPKNAVAVKSFVSTPMINAIAKQHNVETVEQPVGFKYIGEKMFEYAETNKKTFIFGFEESCGYLVHNYAYDKDGVSAALCFASMATLYGRAGKSVFGRLNELYAQYGFYIDKSFSTYYEGLNGAKKMRDIMDRLYDGDIKSIGGLEVEAKRDYLKGVRTSGRGAEKIKLPKNDTLYFELSGGCAVCVRPSGTEPKLKFYVSANAKTQKQAQSAFDAIVEDMKKLTV